MRVCVSAVVVQVKFARPVRGQTSLIWGRSQGHARTHAHTRHRPARRSIVDGASGLVKTREGALARACLSRLAVGGVGRFLFPLYL